MKDNFLTILPKPVKELLQKELVDPQGHRKTWIDLVLEDADTYGFHPEEMVPCLNAAYYVFESTAYPEGWDEEQKLAIVFMAAYRSAFKLLSYGKYKAKRTEGGWMKYDRSDFRGD